MLLVHDALDVFEHHDGIVDHDADRQHHAEQRERVDRIAEQKQAGKGADQRHRHRGERNQGCAPVLQEQEHNEEHQRHRLQQSLYHLAYRYFDETRGVVHVLEFHADRESLRNLRHGLADILGDVERIGARLQEDAEQRGLFAVDATDEIVILRRQLHACHVFQAQCGAARIRANDDFLELPRILKPALGRDGVDQFLRTARGCLADLAGGELRVLFVQRAQKIRGGELQLRHAVRPQPDPHCVILGAEDLHIGRAGHALDGIEHVQRDVVADVQIVEGAIRRIERQHLQE